MMLVRILELYSQTRDDFALTEVMFRVIDWSNEQLHKHMDELQSLLGNFYLRMLSKKILKRLPEGRRHVPLDRRILLSGVTGEGPEGTDPCLELRAKLTDLSERVDAHLKNFEVADALEAIVDVLNTVCNLFLLQLRLSRNPNSHTSILT
jgi:hypothetical protein